MPVAALGLVVGFVLGAAATPVHACSCTEWPAFEEAYAGSQTIFRGTVLRIDAPPPPNEWDILVVFTASATWKGPFGPEIGILTPPSEASCGHPFEVGVEYLVYAYDSWSGLPMTDLCWRNLQASSWDDDLALLGPPRPIAVRGETWGAVKSLYTTDRE